MPTHNNTFQSTKFHQEVILDKTGKRRGTIRITPSGVKWKLKSGQSFYTVTLDAFEKWIIAPSTGARMTKS